MYRLENSSAASKTTILLLKAQAIENKTEYKLKQNMKLKKGKGNKLTSETYERGRTEHKWTQVTPSLQENKNEDKGGRTNML